MRTTNRAGTRARKARKPSDVFTQCPACASPNIFASDGDVFCTYCDWNSITLRADAQFDLLHLYEPGLATVRYMSDRADMAAIDGRKECQEFAELTGGDAA